MIWLVAPGITRLADLPSLVARRAKKESAKYQLADDYEVGREWVRRDGSLVQEPAQTYTGVGQGMDPAAYDVDRTDLRVMEASAPDRSPGGHTLSRHVGKSVDWLRQRITSQGIPTASSFYTREIAEDVIKHAMKSDPAFVSRWLLNPREELVVDLRSLGFDDPQGLGLVLVDKGSSTVLVTPGRVKIRLFSNQGKVGILTAFLEP